MNKTSIRLLWMLPAAAVLVLALVTVQMRGQQSSAIAEVQTIPVQGNIHLLTGAGGNIVVQIGAQGTLVVDSGLQNMSPKVLAAIAKISNKPIQYIINTNFEADHTGGNDALRKAGATYTGANVTYNLTDVGLGAAIISQDNVLQRMSAPFGKVAPTPAGAWPTSTFLTGRKQMSFNEEPIEIIYQPDAHTDGDSIVFFRRSDVIAAGDAFLTTTYPVIDVERGGTIQGAIDALNNIIDIAIPQHQEEGGTYIVPGHGRISDRFEVVEYRDTVTIVRDRIQASMKKGMSLEQVKSSPITPDYDFRYGGPGGAARDRFIEAIYKSLKK